MARPMSEKIVDPTLAVLTAKELWLELRGVYWAIQHAKNHLEEFTPEMEKSEELHNAYFTIDAAATKVWKVLERSGRDLGLNRYMGV